MLQYNNKWSTDGSWNEADMEDINLKNNFKALDKILHWNTALILQLLTCAAPFCSLIQAVPCICRFIFHNKSSHVNMLAQAFFGQRLDSWNGFRSVCSFYCPDISGNLQYENDTFTTLNVHKRSECLISLNYCAHSQLCDQRITSH